MTRVWNYLIQRTLVGHYLTLWGGRVWALSYKTLGSPLDCTLKLWYWISRKSDSEISDFRWYAIRLFAYIWAKISAKSLIAYQLPAIRFYVISDTAWYLKICDFRYQMFGFISGKQGIIWYRGIWEWPSGHECEEYRGVEHIWGGKFAGPMAQLRVRA